MEQVLKFVRLVSIIASQVVNSVFAKFRYYSWIFVYIVRTARFCVSRITLIWNVSTQKIGNPHKIKNLHKQEIEISNAIFYVATFQQHLYVEYMPLSWYDIPELVVPIKIPAMEGCC
jgi:hypothetical protein